MYNFTTSRPVESSHKCDIWLIVSVILLWGFGICTLYICSSYVLNGANALKTQLICSAIGFAGMIFFALLDMKHIQKLVVVIVFVAIILCILAAYGPLSVEKNGGKRWIALPGGNSFQPSELLKLAVILYLANFFDKEYDKPEEDKFVLPAVAMFFLMLGTVVIQKNLSTTLLIGFVGLMMFVVSKSKVKWILPVSLIVIPLIILLIFTEEYRLKRFIGFFNPSANEMSLNYQANKAKMAINRGGMWGTGIGSGLSSFTSVPFVAEDYIFVVIAQQLGFFGVILYTSLISFFAWRGYLAAFRCPNRFAAYGTFGIITIIIIQSLLHCMVVAGVAPSTGLPLPFFSKGGSSELMVLTMCGFVLNTSRCEEKSVF